MPKESDYTLESDPPSPLEEEMLEKARRARRNRRKPETGGVFDTLFGDGSFRMHARNARLAILFKYVTVWFALILVFAGFLLWLYK